MKITRTSILTGVTRTLDIDVSPEQIKAWEGGELIQDAMPHLPQEEREFILSGATQEEWDDAYPEEDDYLPTQNNEDAVLN